MATVQVPEGERAWFGLKPIVSKHDAHLTPHFGDDALVHILDNIPRTNLRVWSADPTLHDMSTYMYVDTTGIGGRDILDCVKRGEFWVNLQRVDKYFPEYATMSAALYEQLMAQCPRLRPLFVHSYILLSSPNMYFQLHVDSYENMFWCVRGGKDFHLYPPADDRVAPREFMEDICSGFREDFLPHQAGNEHLRKTFTIRPGDLLAWPQHSPHEFVNNDQFNVGLGTFHGSVGGMQRIQNYQANQYFREHLPLLRGGTAPDSLGMKIRRGLYRGLRKLSPPPPGKRIQFWTEYRLDPEQPHCMAKLSGGPVLAECSRTAATH